MKDLAFEAGSGVFYYKLFYVFIVHLNVVLALSLLKPVASPLIFSDNSSKIE